MPDPRETMSDDEPEPQAPAGRVGRALHWVREHLWRSVLGTAAAIGLLIAGNVLLVPTAADLVHRGDGLHSQGRHTEALVAYRSAIERAASDDQMAILERIVRCARETEDEPAFMAAALELLKFDPHAWFGDRNLAVARAVVERRIALPAMPDRGRDAPLSTANLAVTRYRLAIVGPYGTPEEKRAAEQQRAEFAATAKTSQEEIAGQDLHPPGPMETIPELLARAANEEVALSFRGQAAYFAARRLDEEGRRAEALEAYRQAYNLTLPSAVVYFGMVSMMESFRPRSMRMEPEMQRFLRQIVEALQRLDPSTPNTLHGGLRFHLDPPDLPPELGLKALVSLARIDPDKTPDPHGPSTALAAGDVPIQLDRTAWLGVVDGRYRLTVKMGRTAGRTSSPLIQPGAQYELLEFDLTPLPAEITIQGETIDLPAIRPYFLKEMNLLEPADGAGVDLDQAAFRWDPIPGASRYEFELSANVRTLGGIILTKFTADTKNAEPTFKIDDFPNPEAQSARGQEAGAENTWQVRAYDDRGQLLAKTLKPRRFVFRGKASPAR